MDWEPEQLDLGALGFTGICRETFQVLLRAILPNSMAGAILSTLLLAQIGANVVLTSRLDDGSNLARLVAFFVFEAACILLLLLLSIVGTATYVFRVASLYCTDGDTDASDRILRDLPVARLGGMFVLVAPPAMLYIMLSIIAWFGLPEAIASHEVGVLLFQLLGGSAFLASAAYVAAVFHIACVVAVLEDAVLFGAVRKSRALLAGKFWAAAAVFVPLDGCFVSLQIAFAQLVLEDALGLGIGFQVAAGAAIALALWAVVVVTLAAQPVVYLVCKNYHHEVVDKVHLNYVGEYQRLAVHSDSGVELQAVKTEQIQSSQCPAGQSPAASSLPSTVVPS